MKQIEKDALQYDGFSYNGCPDHPSGTDRFTSNGYGIHVEPNTPEQQAEIDLLNEELKDQKIPMRDGAFLNSAYVTQYPHETRLKMWKDEYLAARRIVRCKGKRATAEENNRMSFAAMMWYREQHFGDPPQDVSSLKIGDRTPGDPIPSGGGEAN